MVDSQPEREGVKGDEEEEDTCEDLSTPYKRPKPTAFTLRITRFKYHQRAKLPRNIKNKRSGHSDLVQDVLSGPVWHGKELVWRSRSEKCGQLQRAEPKILRRVLTIKELESSHIKGVSPVLRIFAFMHGHDHPKMAKKLNDKNPKKVDDMLVKVIRVNSQQGTLEKKNLNKFCDYHGDRGHNTNDCYHLKKQIEEVVASGKLTHLVKDIRQAMIEGFKVRRIYIDRQSLPEIKYEHFFRSFDAYIKSNLRKSSAPLEEANSLVIIFYSKMPLPLHSHPRKDEDEKPWSSRINHTPMNVGGRYGCASVCHGTLVKNVPLGGIYGPKEAMPEPGPKKGAEGESV
ncbi:hypothetical protein Tco_1406333 [Tanacetum coccineum]